MSKKWIFLCIAVLMILLSACDKDGKVAEIKDDFSNRLASVSIPFDWFYDASLLKQEEVVIPKIDGLDLNQIEIPHVAWDNFRKNLTTLSETISKDTTTSNTDKNIDAVITSETINWEEWNAVLSMIEQEEHQYFDSFTFRGIGERISNGVHHYQGWVEMNTVNDSEEFYIIPLLFTFEKNGSISSIDVMNEPYRSKYTVTPLKEDAFLYESTHISFTEKWNKLLKQLDLLGKEDSESVQDIIKETDINVELETLQELQALRLSTFEESFVGYMLDDKNLKSETIYEYVIANESGLYHYSIGFDRGDLSLTSIQTRKNRSES